MSIDPDHPPSPDPFGAWRKNEKYGGFFAKPGWDGMVGLAVEQQGVLGLWQLVGLGVSERAAQAQAAVARLHRIHHGVYGLVPRRLLSREALFMAAVLACGPGAALSHRAAASLLGLLRNNRTKMDVTIPGSSHRKRPGLDIHRSTTLRPDDVVRVQNIPCTTVARTLLDIAATVSGGQLIRAFDQSEHLGLFDLTALQDQLERNPTRRGATRIRTILEEDYTASNPTRSDFEDILIPLVAEARLPRPEINKWIVLPDGERAICVDFCWPGHKLVVETDGRKTHHTVQAFERDRRNDQRLAAAGWIVLRITWKQLRYEPRRVLNTIANVLDAQASRP